MFKRGGVVAFEAPQNVRIVPDIERVASLVMKNPSARKTWSWLILPVRFGYPAVSSPAAGIVAHAETGNLAVYGPTHNSGWNQTGPASGFHAYDPTSCRSSSRHPGRMSSATRWATST